MVYKLDEAEAESMLPPEPAAEPQPSPPVVTLSFEGREVPMTGDRIVLGRSRECDIRLADANVSRRHAEVRQEDGTYWVIDLGSTNGTELNGRRSSGHSSPTEIASRSARPMSASGRAQ